MNYQQAGLPPRPSTSSANAFAQNLYQSGYSSHYAQAYMQAAAPAQQAYHPVQQYQLNPAASSSGGQNSNFASSSSWYQGGGSRCTYKNCTFTGSQKTVEIHMMDRHLIYPPGWEKRKKKDDWDADASLKGKPIPIQGTNVRLDTAESLEAWIAERKRRWPSANRVEDKKRKLAEALERGQLSPEEVGLRPGKRQATDNRNTDDRRNAGRDQRGNGRGRGRGASRGRGRAVDSGWQGRTPGGSLPQGSSSVPTQPFALPSKPITSPAKVASGSSSSDSDSDDEDGAPEVVSSKPMEPVAEPPEAVQEPPNEPPCQEVPQRIESVMRPPKKQHPPQPKKPPQNPFATRPSLLRNLLLPEIRITVSNLSQAIRFLVDNDFLRQVELKPGDAANQKITVMPEASSAQAEKTEDQALP
ncbi:hypothetical protein HGRIS_007810 [Hohenbuehelia grisea]|uniref:FMR1-interacting protein 1 conserved domain-containing protein n=1 Tax=Hohenbuehelia grisea TaxID=104357 RepID=A0ABR3J652_9AGAR